MYHVIIDISQQYITREAGKSCLLRRLLNVDDEMVSMILYRRELNNNVLEYLKVLLLILRKMDIVHFVLLFASGYFYS